MEDKRVEYIIGDITKYEDYAEENSMVIADDRLRELGYDIFPKDTFFVRAGESIKSFENLRELLSKMDERHLDRNSTLIGVGGGTITDLVGFLAGIYMRGIRHVFVPTTLLGMVDASIGGKCGINFNGAKNNIGLIKTPKKIYLDKNFLKTLQRDDINDGMTEAIKIFSMFDRDRLYAIKKLIDENKNYDAIIDLVIPEASYLKDEIVFRDLFENGIRTLLNLGHTLGHAIEKASNYTISHGRAVAIGLIFESKNKLFGEHISDSFTKIFEGLYEDKLYLSLDKIDKEKLKSAVLRDKKKNSSLIKFPYIREFGDASYKEVDFKCLVEELIGYL